MRAQTDLHNREHSVIMLLSSVLQILDRIQVQSPPIGMAEVEPFEKVLVSAVEEQSSPKKIESEIPEALELLESFVPPPAPVVSTQRMEGLIRAFTKFEEPKRRVVDVFE
jgi:hypothetical protein